MGLAALLEVNQMNSNNLPFFVDYPQEQIEGHMNSYQCKYCKEHALKINGRLEGHRSNCEYRISKEKELRQAGLNKPC